jgi:hypothetical protein
MELVLTHRPADSNNAVSRANVDRSVEHTASIMPSDLNMCLRASFGPLSPQRRKKSQHRLIDHQYGSIGWKPHQR